MIVEVDSTQANRVKLSQARVIVRTSARWRSFNLVISIADQ